MNILANSQAILKKTVKKILQRSRLIVDFEKS